MRSADGEPSVGELVRRVSEHASTLVRAEVELAKTELTGSVKRAGIGGGMLAAAGVVLLFSVPFLFVVLAEVLVELGLARWAAYLIVWVLFLIVAAVLGLLGRRSLKKVRKPERTIETVRETAAWVRHPTSSAGTGALPAVGTGALPSAGTARGATPPGALPPGATAGRA